MQFVNGDGIDEFFNHIEVPNGTLFTLFTNLYAYTFVLLLTYFSLNVLIAINEEAVFDTRYRGCPSLLNDKYVGCYERGNQSENRIWHSILPFL